MKIAKYKDIQYGYDCYQSESFDAVPGYVRLTEFLEVEFKLLDSDSQIQKHVAALDHKRQKIVEDFTAKLAELDAQKAELLALTYQPELP